MTDRMEKRRASRQLRSMIVAAMCDHLLTGPGVYQIINWVTGKRYVGASKNVRNRCRLHIGLLLSRNHYSGKMQRSFQKYGRHAFAFELIESCEVESLNARERHWHVELSPAFCSAAVSNATRNYRRVPRQVTR